MDHYVQVILRDFYGIHTVSDFVSWNTILHEKLTVSSHQINHTVAQKLYTTIHYDMFFILRESDLKEKGHHFGIGLYKWVISKKS